MLEMKNLYILVEKIVLYRCESRPDFYGAATLNWDTTHLIGKIN
ncbi:hypothetical protein DsansV1_C01g0006081 [Dioscorea sansibarensis]